MQSSQTLLPDAAPPLISFIVPCYNVPALWLTACVQSLLDLPMADGEREVIVVDDGSTQPVRPLLQPYGDRVRCVRQENGGLSEARNAGIRLARGRYIQFVDGDDRLLVPAYMRCVRLAHEGRWDMICFRLTRKHLSDCALPEVPTAESLRPKNGAEYMLRHNLRASACGYLFRRSLLGGLLFTKGLLHEDEAFTPLLMLNAHSVCDLPVHAYYYRTSPHSITRSTESGRVRHRLHCKAQIALRLRQESERRTSIAQAALCRRADQLAMDLLLDALRSPLPGADFRACLARWRRDMLLPLAFSPCHTPLYVLFALLSRCRLALCLLHAFMGRAGRR